MTAEAKIQPQAKPKPNKNGACNLLVAAVSFSPAIVRAAAAPRRVSFTQALWAMIGYELCMMMKPHALHPSSHTTPFFTPTHQGSCQVNTLLVVLHYHVKL
eukprot:scaffold69855_cov27-Tisochrysis_lutea.AAC.5